VFFVVNFLHGLLFCCFRQFRPACGGASARRLKNTTIQQLYTFLEKESNLFPVFITGPVADGLQEVSLDERGRLHRRAGDLRAGRLAHVAVRRLLVVVEHERVPPQPRLVLHDADQHLGGAADGHRRHARQPDLRLRRLHGSGVRLGGAVARLRPRLSVKSRQVARLEGEHVDAAGGGGARLQGQHRGHRRRRFALHCKRRRSKEQVQIGGGSPWRL
jgi:hypothetical protein